MQVVRALLAAGAAEEWPTSRNGSTPLHWAVQGGHEEVVKVRMKKLNGENKLPGRAVKMAKVRNWVAEPAAQPVECVWVSAHTLPCSLLSGVLGGRLCRC